MAEEADEQVRFYPFGFLMKDRPQSDIGFCAAESGFSLCELDVPAADFGRIGLGAIGAQQISSLGKRATKGRQRGQPNVSCFFCLSIVRVLFFWWEWLAVLESSIPVRFIM